MKIAKLVAAVMTMVALTGGLFVAAGTANAAADKVYVCHHTSSETNPVVVIHISRSALDKHLENHGGTGADDFSETPITADECGNLE
jgi:hypothetical protein